MLASEAKTDKTEAANPLPPGPEDILTKAGFAHVATLGPDGGPQTTPVWYDWDGTDLLVSQTTGRQKYRNIRRDPRVAVSITDPDNPYRYVELRGRITSIADDEANAFIDALARRYMGVDTYPYHRPGDHRVVVRIHPEHVTSMG